MVRQRRITERGQQRSDRAIPPVRKIVGSRIRSAREAALLSQHELGARAGLSGKFIGEVERGQKSPTVDSLYRIARALKRPVESLLG